MMFDKAQSSCVGDGGEALPIEPHSHRDARRKPTMQIHNRSTHGPQVQTNVIRLWTLQATSVRFLHKEKRPVFLTIGAFPERYHVYIHVRFTDVAQTTNFLCVHEKYYTSGYSRCQPLDYEVHA